jgi:hypothetical protein
MGPLLKSRIEQDVSEEQAQVQDSRDAEHLEAQGAPDVSTADIWNSVERLCRSRVMSGCTRLTPLLTFVVGSTLRGEAAYLKETTIGVHVFGRDPAYDPKVDTIVRSQAWRLRSKLRKYYASEGANDRIIIEIPVGHYVPVFRIRERGDGIQ